MNEVRRQVDLSPAAVVARLRAAAALSDLTSSRHLATKVDISPGAVIRRLTQVAELRRLCLRLAGSVQEFRPARS